MDMTLKLKVTKDGKPFLTSDGIHYHGMNAAQVGYVVGKLAETGTYVDMHKSGNGPFAVWLYADVDGKPLNGPDGNPAPGGYSKSGLSLAQFHDIEEHLGLVQTEMAQFSRKLLKAAGKL